MNSTLQFCLDPDYLSILLTKYSDIYSHAKPFPHVVIDNFLPESVLENILSEFPPPDAINWKKYDKAFEKKLGSTSELQMGEATRFLLYQLNSSIFIDFLEKLTGLEGLIPDPYFEGGGLHQIEKGGFLKVHVDFNRHKKLPLDRRINIIIYLNKDWQEEYGGYLELWNNNLTGCEKKVLPIFNRCLIFNTNDFTYHGHPEPLTCPEGLTRKSLALYYFSNGRPPEELKRDDHRSVFYTETGQEYQDEKPLSTRIKTLLKKFIPPIVIDAKNYLLPKS